MKQKWDKKESQMRHNEISPILAQYFGGQSDTNYVLDHIMPILLKRSSDGVHSLDKPPSKAHLRKINDFMDAAVSIGQLEAVNKGPAYLTKLYSQLHSDPKSSGPPQPKNTKPKGQMTPKQIYARLEIIEKVLTSQQRHIAKHWTVEQMFDETFRSRVVHLN